MESGKINFILEERMITAGKEFVRNWARYRSFGIDQGINTTAPPFNNDVHPFWPDVALSTALVSMDKELGIS